MLSSTATAVAATVRVVASRRIIIGQAAKSAASRSGAGASIASKSLSSAAAGASSFSHPGSSGKCHCVQCQSRTLVTASPRTGKHLIETVDPAFDKLVKEHFPGAMPNFDLKAKVTSILATKGYNGSNTLLCTSLCCDELARTLEDDFVAIYGDNFNLGGLAGFPFAGNTGFGAMSGHIPDNGYCFLLFGPHVGITKDGIIGKVERSGIDLVDNCCGSAIVANAYLMGITHGGAQVTAKLQEFSDFQQGAVQELILPHGKRLTDADNRMRELPYALYESQELLVGEIVRKGAPNTKAGLAVMGGIQINTGPDTPDYFHPLKFDYMNNKAEIVEDLLPSLQT